MHPAKRYLMIAACFAFAVTVMGVMAPRIANAATATLVEIVNTAANPVLTRATDNPARRAVLLTLAGTSGDGQTLADGQASAEFTFEDANGAYTVPTGFRLVIDSINAGQFGLASGQVPQLMLMETSTNGLNGGFSLPLQRMPSGVYLYSGNYTAYADAGTTVRLFVVRSGSSGTASVFASLYGHLEHGR